MAAIDRAAKRRFAFAVARFDVGALQYQRFGERSMPTPRGHVKRGTALDAFRGIQVRTEAHEECYQVLHRRVGNIGRAGKSVAGVVERRVPRAVERVWIGAESKQKPCKWCIPPGCRAMQERVASADTHGSRVRFGRKGCLCRFRKFGTIANRHTDEDFKPCLNLSVKRETNLSTGCQFANGRPIAPLRRLKKRVDRCNDLPALSEAFR